jgi:hypothetical protein
VIRNKKTKVQAERENVDLQKRFNGQSVDISASELPDGFSERNINCIDRGSYWEGRTGTRKYSNTVAPSNKIIGRIDHKKAGLVISIYEDAYGVEGDNLVFISDKVLTYYEEVVCLKGVVISNPSKIIEFNENAVIVNSDGIFLLVLGDEFKYVRKMNSDLPRVLLTDIPETSEKKYGYRYLYSYLQRSGSMKGWDRLKEGFPPIFESGTNKIGEGGKDFAECYFEVACSSRATENIVGDFSIDISIEELLPITHYGVYRSKQIGTHTEPPGMGLGGLNNDPSLCVWIKDIPVLKCFKASQTNSKIVELSDGETSEDDIGCTLYWENGGSAIIEGVAGPTSYTVTVSGTVASKVCGIGGGRLFTAYQSGNRLYSEDAIFDDSDAGKPVFFADGTITWIKEFGSAYNVVIGFDQSIKKQSATMAPLVGVMTRKYNDTFSDGGDGTGVIGIQERMSQQIYWPRRFFSPLPGGDIAYSDFGFFVVAQRGNTFIKYSQVGDKQYTLGYYRADIQKENVESHITQILTVGGAMVIFLSNSTRVANPQTASDVGNNAVAESIYKIPPSYEVSKIGVVLWKSIAFKSGIVYAITSEPAVRTFNGTSWSENNFAFNQVQKYIASIDQNEPLEAVYISGKYGGYHVWFKRWAQL